MTEINIENATDGFEEEAVEPEWPAEESEMGNPGSTPLFQLKTRRDEIAKELVKSFQVPRWEQPEIYLEFALIDPSTLAKALQKREKQKNRPDDWVARAYADVLSLNCKSVYAVMEGDHSVRYSLRPDDPTGRPTKVDHDLSRALGLDPVSSNASDTFRALFFSEGDLIEVANQIFRWSAVVGEEADENF